jgi:hypothetical protein
MVVRHAGTKIPPVTSPLRNQRGCPQILPDADGFSFLTSGRTVGHLERSPDRVVFPQNDAANRCNPPSSALVAKERPNGAAERSVGRIMPRTMTKA